MKALFLCLMLMLAGIMATGCSSCQSENNKQADVEELTTGEDYDGVIPDMTAGVDHIQALHRQQMSNLIDGAEYQWRNSQVHFNDTITLDNLDELKVTDVTDIFYYWSDGPWTQFITTNVAKGTIIPKPVQDVWIEDSNLSDVEIKLNAEDVLLRLKEWDGILPDGATMMVLRLPVGPMYCNAQWVIGGIRDVIFIDAVTGRISNWNPAFNPDGNPKEGNTAKPFVK